MTGRMLPHLPLHGLGRRSGALLVGLVCLFAGLALGAGSAGATGGTKFLDVVEVDGPLDPVQFDYLLGVLERAAEDSRVQAVVLRVDSPGSLGVDSMRLARAVHDLPKPVVAWVAKQGGPGRAGGGALLVVAAAHIVAMSPDAELGPLSPEDLRSGNAVSKDAAERQLAALLPKGRSPDAYLAALDERVGAKKAAALGATDYSAAFLLEAIGRANGRSAVLSSGKVEKLELGRLAGRRFEPTVTTRIFKLTGFDGFLHKIDTPTYAYVLLLLGCAAITFEFFSASIGIAGIIGALCLVASFQAMGNLPMNWWAVALLVAAVVVFSVDVGRGRLGVLSLGATACMVLGSLYFSSDPGFAVRWWSMLIVVVGMLLFFAIGMTTVVRTRFSTPAIGRERLVGRGGLTETALAPDGLVAIEAAVWPARARSGSIPSGAAVTVSEVDGLALVVDAGSPDVTAVTPETPPE